MAVNSGHGVVSLAWGRGVYCEMVKIPPRMLLFVVSANNYNQYLENTPSMPDVVLSTLYTLSREFPRIVLTR